MSRPKSDEGAVPELVPWLLSRFDPYAVRSRDPSSPELARRAEDRLRRYIDDLAPDSPSGPGPEPL